MSQTNNKECFVIMPLSEVEGYDKGHFQTVYEDLIKPAVENAGYNPMKADEVGKTNLIHLDILQRLMNAPIVICDLSTRNPNVLFELGVRQAFDKPVVLIQEKGTPKIFDISSLRYLEYSKSLKYRDVLKTQDDLKAMIEETIAAKDDAANVNSIVKLLALTPASLPKLDRVNKENMTLDLIQTQIADLTKMVGQTVHNIRFAPARNIYVGEYDRLAMRVEKFRAMRNSVEKERLWQQLVHDVEEMMMICEDRDGRRMFERLMRRLHEEVEIPKL